MRVICSCHESLTSYRQELQLAEQLADGDAQQEALESIAQIHVILGDVEKYVFHSSDFLYPQYRVSELLPSISVKSNLPNIKIQQLLNA